MARRRSVRVRPGARRAAVRSYEGVGERERFDRASFVAVLAAATGEPEPVDLAVEVLAASPMVDASPANTARYAAAVAAQRVVHHDDAGAVAAIDAFVRGQSRDLDPLADAFLRRSLGVPYVCSAPLRRRWDAMELGPSQQRARAIARLLLDARAGGGVWLGVEPESLASVCTVLPLPWSVELAVRAAARGREWGHTLAEDLADRFGPAVRRELGLLAHDADAELRGGATAVRRALPTTPPGVVSIRVLGPLGIVRAGDPVDAPELRRGRVRELLSALVVERSLTRARTRTCSGPTSTRPRPGPTCG